MTTHRFCNEEMAINITWLAPVLWSTPSRERRKIRELMSLPLNPVGYAELETSVGYQLGATPDHNDVGLISAGALLAQAQRSAVLVQQLDEDRFWLCTVEDGAVFPAGDLVGNREFIAERLREIRSDIAGKNIPLFDKSASFAIEDALPSDFDDLVNGVKPTSDISCKPITSKKVNKTGLIAISIGLITCLSIGTWQYFSYMEKAQAQHMQNQQATQNAHNQKRLALQRSLNQNSSALLATIADKIFDRPLRAAGWRVHSYEWQNDVILVTWHRNHGSISDIKKYLAEGEYQFFEDATSLVEKIEFPATVRAQADDVETRLANASDRLQLLDTLSALPGQWSLKPARPIGDDYPVTRAQLSGNSNQLHEMIATAVSLKDLPLKVSRITVRLGDSFQWELEGDYFAKSD